MRPSNPTRVLRAVHCRPGCTSCSSAARAPWCAAAAWDAFSNAIGLEVHLHQGCAGSGTLAGLLAQVPEGRLRRFVMVAPTGSEAARRWRRWWPTGALPAGTAGLATIDISGARITTADLQLASFPDVAAVALSICSGTDLQYDDAAWAPTTGEGLRCLSPSSPGSPVVPSAWSYRSEP